MTTLAAISNDVELTELTTVDSVLADIKANAERIGLNMADMRETVQKWVAAGSALPKAEAVQVLREVIKHANNWHGINFDQLSEYLVDNIEGITIKISRKGPSIQFVKDVEYKVNLIGVWWEHHRDNDDDESPEKTLEQRVYAFCEKEYNKDVSREELAQYIHPSFVNYVFDKCDQS